MDCIIGVGTSPHHPIIQPFFTRIHFVLRTHLSRDVVIAVQLGKSWWYCCCCCCIACWSYIRGRTSASLMKIVDDDLAIDDHWGAVRNISVLLRSQWGPNKNTTNHGQTKANNLQTRHFGFDHISSSFWWFPLLFGSTRPQTTKAALRYLLLCIQEIFAHCIFLNHGQITKPVGETQLIDPHYTISYINRQESREATRVAIDQQSTNRRKVAAFLRCGTMNLLGSATNRHTPQVGD